MSQDVKILLVEDDVSMGYLLTTILEQEGYTVRLCRNSEEGLQEYGPGFYDLCILDVMMPGMDGFTLAKKLREMDPAVRFLFLTARSLKEDLLHGFALGAEDYIRKPFDKEELICRLHVMLRRKEHSLEDTTHREQKFVLGEYVFDYSRQELSRNNERWRMTEKENEVLR